MTRKRFCKLIMEQEIQKNTAAKMAKEVGKAGLCPSQFKGQ